MKIVRLLPSDGRECFAQQHPDDKLTRLTGDLYTGLTDTGESVIRQTAGSAAAR